MTCENEATAVLVVYDAGTADPRRIAVCADHEAQVIAQLEAAGVTVLLDDDTAGERNGICQA